MCDGTKLFFSHTPLPAMYVPPSEILFVQCVAHFNFCLVIKPAFIRIDTQEMKLERKINVARVELIDISKHDTKHETKGIKILLVIPCLLISSLYI